MFNGSDADTSPSAIMAAVRTAHGAQPADCTAAFNPDEGLLLRRPTRIADAADNPDPWPDRPRAV